MNAPPPLIFDLSPDALRDILAAASMPAFRAEQVLAWVYDKGVADPAAMTNLSASDRDKLASLVRFSSCVKRKHQTASDGVQKLLVAWKSNDSPEVGDVQPIAPSDTASDQGNATHPLAVVNAAPALPETECVMIPTEKRRTACISSQVGCAVGCRFCASGIGGLEGNLSAGQIVEQVWLLNQLPAVERITNVVFMGMGEPLANFEQVSRAVTTLMADWGMGISGRRITISTVGLPAQMRRLADLALPVTLAISLHAPNDELRRQLIPWADYVSIAQLLEAGRYYFEKTGREITLEYILLGGVNDQPPHARELAKLTRQLRANVNLIRYNEVAGIPYRRPSTDDVHRFQELLRGAGVNAHIRASRGRDIAAACGQLRHESQAGANPST